MEVRENLISVSTPRFLLRVWMNAGPDDPGFARDHAAILTYTDVHAELLERMPYDDVCDLIASEFPRAAAIEVLDPDTRCGVLLYPEWP